jgi:dihydroceramidase
VKAELTYFKGLQHHTVHWRIREHAYQHHIWYVSPKQSNSIYTNINTVIYGVHGLRRIYPKPDGGLISTLAFPYWGLIGVGLLSAWFHATLKYHSQMGDDLSMFLAVGAILHQLLCFQASPTDRRKYTAYILGTLIPISVYHVWADEIVLHEVAFAVMIYLVSRETRKLIKKRVGSEAERKRLGRMATFGICKSFFIFSFVIESDYTNLFV